VLVTEDRRLRIRARAEGGEVWHPKDFVEFINSLERGGLLAPA
jgi:hypothetical protein